MNETNADWWTGSHNAKQGLFPSNYVEKLPPAALPSPALSQYSEKVATPGGGPGYPMVPTYSAYQPTGGYQGPPPPTQGGYSPYGAAPATALAPVEQHPPTAAHEQNPGKKGKLGGKLGNTVRHLHRFGKLCSFKFGSWLTRLWAVLASEQVQPFSFSYRNPCY